MTPTAIVSLRGEQRVRSGHPWVYKTDVADVRADPGDRVLVRSVRGQVLGSALYSSRSQIALRILSHGDAFPDDALIRLRLEAALGFRRTLNIDGTAFRLVHGEADRLPSLVVDQYGDYLVVQALSQGMDRLTPVVVQALQDLLRPAGILARNDPRARSLEGLDRRVDTLIGEIPDSVPVRISGVEYLADLRHGQKTGLFLDQRENREAARSYATGRLLDCFSYQGGFALTLAPGCSEIVALDVSDEAVNAIRANGARNAIDVDARVGNVFDELRAFERSGERFDAIVLDPPAFAKARAAVPKATAGYKEINLRALKLLNPAGTLVTCSCSYHIGEHALLNIVQEAAADAGAEVTIVEKRMQSRDHPVLLSAPETYYLKCFILRKH